MSSSPTLSPPKKKKRVSFTKDTKMSASPSDAQDDRQSGEARRSKGVRYTSPPPDTAALSASRDRGGSQEGAAIARDGDVADGRWRVFRETDLPLRARGLVSSANASARMSTAGRNDAGGPGVEVPSSPCLSQELSSTTTSPDAHAASPSLSPLRAEVKVEAAAAKHQLNEDVFSIPESPPLPASPSHFSFSAIPPATALVKTSQMDTEISPMSLPPAISPGSSSAFDKRRYHIPDADVDMDACSDVDAGTEKDAERYVYGWSSRDAGSPSSNRMAEIRALRKVRNGLDSSGSGMASTGRRRSGTGTGSARAVSNAAGEGRDNGAESSTEGPMERPQARERRHAFSEGSEGRFEGIVDEGVVSMGEDDVGGGNVLEGNATNGGSGILLGKGDTEMVATDADADVDIE